MTYLFFNVLFLSYSGRFYRIAIEDQRDSPPSGETFVDGASFHQTRHMCIVLVRMRSSLWLWALGCGVQLVRAFHLATRKSATYKRRKAGELHFQNPSQQQSSALRTDLLLLSLLPLTPLPSKAPSILAKEITQTVRELEQRCPTPDAELQEKLNGEWELLWVSNLEPETSFSTTKNEKEEPSPSGSSNNHLPLSFDRLQQLGHVAKATQSVDFVGRTLSNVMAIGNDNMGSIQIDISFSPSLADERCIIIKCETFRLRFGGGFPSLSIPLGPVGPVGWLKTTYIDQNIRIARGNLGSVFILKRIHVKE